jgi:hypothetical protein
MKTETTNKTLIDFYRVKKTGLPVWDKLTKDVNATSKLIRDINFDVAIALSQLVDPTTVTATDLNEALLTLDYIRFQLQQFDEKTQLLKGVQAHD